MIKENNLKPYTVHYRDFKNIRLENCFFSTHQLNEVRDIADQIVVMKSGEKIFDGDNNEFQELDSNKNFTEIFMELVNE